MAFLSQSEAQAKADREAELRRRAARQAANQAANPVPEKIVTVRVTKLGHDKIHMGHHVGGIGEAFYERGETFDLAEEIAISLEDRGFVEIEGEVQPEIPQLAPKGGKSGQPGAEA